MSGTEKDFIEFDLNAGRASSSDVVVVTEPPIVLRAETKLDEMPPVFRELAEPKLPQLTHETRARLLMQTPNRIFFYWSIGSHPFQKLSRALGPHVESYSLVVRLLNITRDSEEIHRVDAEGSWWFSVEADTEYRAEVGFYAPNRPFVRALYSNTIVTPRKNPSPRMDTEADWSISNDRFAKVLEVAGFTQDAFEVAIAGDDVDVADATTHAAFSDLIDEPDFDTTGVPYDELRSAMLLLASGLSLDQMRWRVSPSLFALLQKYAAMLSAEKALDVLQKRFDVQASEITEEELGPAVHGVSSIHFPRRLKTKRTLPRLESVSSPSSPGRW
jgi:hypothetical protein